MCNGMMLRDRIQSLESQNVLERTVNGHGGAISGPKMTAEKGTINIFRTKSSPRVPDIFDNNFNKGR